MQLLTLTMAVLHVAVPRLGIGLINVINNTCAFPPITSQNVCCAIAITLSTQTVQKLLMLPVILLSFTFNTTIITLLCCNYCTKDPCSNH